MPEYSRLSPENALSYVANATVPHTLEYFEDYRVDSDAINNSALVHETPTNRGVKVSGKGRRLIEALSTYAQPDVVCPSVWRPPSIAVAVCEPGCDYLTLTATDDRGKQQLFEVMLPLSDDLREGGDDTKYGKELQYEGHRVGRHLFYGESIRQGAYLRVSGSPAGAALERVRSFQERYFHATRYDAQLTPVYDAQPGEDFFRLMARTSLEYGKSGGHGGRPWNTDCHVTFERGDTAYIGDKKTAEKYGCAYDKHFEGLHTGTDYPIGAVRFEARHRREQANMLLAQVCGADDVREFHAGYVAGFYAARGIDVAIELQLLDQLPSVSHQTDTEKRRKWFRSQVRRGAQLNAQFVGLEGTLKDLGLWEQVCKELLDEH